MQIALTFDDGPHTDPTAALLDILEREQVKATFFIVGENLTPETAPLVKRAYQLGCEIANHSFSHPDMTPLTAQEITQEIQETSARIFAVTGEYPRFFRPPYIAVKDEMFDAVGLPFIAGYGVRDYDDAVTADERFDGVMEKAQDGRIILLHDAEENHRTVEAVTRLIPALRQQGYEFVTVSELFASAGITPSHKDRQIYSYVHQTEQYAQDT